MKYSESELSIINRALELVRERGPVFTGAAFTSPTEGLGVLRLTLAQQEDSASREYFIVAYLNSQHDVISIRAEFSGTLDGAAVYPRVVVKRALELDAAAVVLCHNHPSGDCRPSEADKRITSRLRDALGLVDIRVLDHIILGGGDKFCSFAQDGLI